MSSNILYCSKFACTDATLLSIDKIYIINQQNGLNVFSGDRSETRIYFRGDNSGDNVYYRCEQNSVCFIDCGIDACNKNTTLLICDGKCFVTCDGMDGNTECVNIVSSLAPTSAPTTSPSSSPTAQPTASKGLHITDKDVSIWFNWTLTCVGSFVLIIVIVGRIDSKKYHKNDLFRWNYLLVFGVYTVDFCSGMGVVTIFTKQFCWFFNFGGMR